MNRYSRYSRHKAINRNSKILVYIATTLITLCIIIYFTVHFTSVESEVKSVSKEQSTSREAAQSSEATPKEESAVALKEEPKEATATETGKTVYLTFDDGPYQSTPQLLDVLDQYNVKATFFVTAQFLNEADLIEQIKEIDKRGHEVAVHSYSHDYQTIYSSVEAYVQDYNKMDDIIYKATGKRSTIFRFPGGSNGGYSKYIRTELIGKMNSLGLTYYDWNAYDGDCDGYKGQALINRAVAESSCTDRSILLMHDIPGKETVIESMPAIIEQLREKGYNFAPLDASVEPIQFVKQETF